MISRHASTSRIQHTDFGDCVCHALVFGQVIDSIALESPNSFSHYKRANGRGQEEAMVSNAWANG